MSEDLKSKLRKSVRETFQLGLRAADRIEELEAENLELERKLNLYRDMLDPDRLLTDGFEAVNMVKEKRDE